MFPFTAEAAGFIKGDRKLFANNSIIECFLCIRLLLYCAYSCGYYYIVHTHAYLLPRYQRFEHGTTYSMVVNALSELGIFFFVIVDPHESKVLHVAFFAKVKNALPSHGTQGKTICSPCESNSVK